VKQPRKIDDLMASKCNPHTACAAAAAGLGRSLADFGDIAGITWNSRTGELVTGHKRLAALKAKHGDALKIKAGAIVAPGGERFQIRVVNWPPEKAAAALLAANNPEIQGRFTPEAAGLLAELQGADPERFTALRLDALLESLNKAAGIKDKKNEADELAAEIKLEQEHLDAIVNVNRIVARIEAALSRRAAKCPADINNALAIIIDNRGGDNLLVLLDANTRDAIAEIERMAAAGDESPVERILESYLADHWPTKPKQRSRK